MMRTVLVCLLVVASVAALDKPAPTQIQGKRAAYPDSSSPAPQTQYNGAPQGQYNGAPQGPVGYSGAAITTLSQGQAATYPQVNLLSQEQQSASISSQEQRPAVKETFTIIDSHEEIGGVTSTTAAPTAHGLSAEALEGFKQKSNIVEQTSNNIDEQVQIPVAVNKPYSLSVPYTASQQSFLAPQPVAVPAQTYSVGAPQQAFTSVPQQNFASAPQQNFASAQQTFASAPQQNFASAQQIFASAPQQIFASAPQQIFASAPQQNFASAAQVKFASAPQVNYVSAPQVNYASAPQVSYASAPQLKFAPAPQPNFASAPLFSQYSFANNLPAFNLQSFAAPLQTSSQLLSTSEQQTVYPTQAPLVNVPQTKSKLLSKQQTVTTTPAPLVNVPQSNSQFLSTQQFQTVIPTQAPLVHVPHSFHFNPLSPEIFYNGAPNHVISLPAVYSTAKPIFAQSPISLQQPAFNLHPALSLHQPLLTAKQLNVELSPLSPTTVAPITFDAIHTVTPTPLPITISTVTPTPVPITFDNIQSSYDGPSHQYLPPETLIKK